MVKEKLLLTDRITRTMNLKVFILLLFLPFLSFSAIEHCIDSKFKELVQENRKKDIKDADLQSIAIKVCNSINTQEIVDIKIQTKKIKTASKRNSQSSCIKRRLSELGAQRYKGNLNKITELKNIATADCFNVNSSNRQISKKTLTNSIQNHRDVSHMDYETCVEKKIAQLGGYQVHPNILKKIKKQANRECL